MAKARKRSETASSPNREETVALQDRPHTDHPFDDAQGEMPDPRQRIAARAYELYLQRGGNDGQDFDDWLAAERELGAGGETPQAEDFEPGK
jgi:hypothetical protein